MSPNTQTHRYLHVVRHIVSYGLHGPRHRTTRELTLIRIGGKPCLPNGFEVRLPNQQFTQFNQTCPHNGQAMRFPNAIVQHDTVGNWRLVTDQPASIDGAIHLFDLYPPKDVDVVGIASKIPQQQPVATAWTSNGTGPVFFEKFGLGACLFAPLDYGFTAEVKLNGAPDTFHIHAHTVSALGGSTRKKKKRRTGSFTVRCGRDALKWMQVPDPVAA